MMVNKYSFQKINSPHLAALYGIGSNCGVKSIGKKNGVEVEKKDAQKIV